MTRRKDDDVTEMKTKAKTETEIKAKTEMKIEKLKKEGDFWKKDGFFVGKPMDFLCAEMNIYAKQEEEMNKYPKQRL